MTYRAAIEGYRVSAPTSLFIGGEWREAADGVRFPVVDPGTGEVLTTVSSGGVRDARSAVQAASDAADEWAATPPRRRSDVLMGAYEIVTQRAEQLACPIVAENGKALPGARSKVSYASEFFRWYAEESVRVPGSWQTAPGGAHRILVTGQPIGGTSPLPWPPERSGRRWERGAPSSSSRRWRPRSLPCGWPPPSRRPACPRES